MRGQDDYKAERRGKTFDSAKALADDLQFIRRFVGSPNPEAGDIRRMSALLRRILVDATLERIAAPRVGKLLIRTMKTDDIVRLNRADPIEFLGLGGVSMFGMEIFAIHLGGSGASEWPSPLNTELTPNDFLKQGVIVWNGRWISRRDIIRYIANVADGVHAGEDKTELDRLIRRVRGTFGMSFQDGTTTFTINHNAFVAVEIPKTLTNAVVDWPLLEVWSAGANLVASPDVQRLVEYIANEDR